MKSTKALAGSLARIVLSAFLMLALLVPLAAQAGTITGTVTDKTDGEGVYGASVTVNGTTIGTATDLDGNFTLRNVPETTQKVSVSIIGYSPATQAVTVGAAGATADFTLSQTTVMASEVVVGAAMYEQDRLDMPVTANVVSSEQIKEQPNPTLGEVIEDVPGVVVTRSGGTSSSSMQIRGSNNFNGGGIGTRVQALYDGFPINAPESGEVVWQSVNMNDADKVEVLKGAAATLYGSGAMGGVVNVSGHMPDKLEVRGGASIGFYDKVTDADEGSYRDGYTPIFWNNYVGIGNKQGKWTYDVIYSHSDDDGHRENAHNYMNDVKLKARYDIDATQYLQLSSFYTSTVGGYAYNWAYETVTAFGAPTMSPIDGGAYDVYRTFTGDLVPTAYSANYDDIYSDDLIKRKNALVGLNYVNMLSDKLSLDTRLYYTYNSTRYEYNNTDSDQIYPTGGGLLAAPFNGPAYPSVRIPGQFNETGSHRYGLGTKLDWKLNDKHRLLFGIDGNIVDTRTTQIAAEFPVVGEFNNIQERNIAAFVQDEWKITDKLTSLISARYDWSGIDADEAWTTATEKVDLNNKSVDAISPRVALNYRAMDDMAFRASWGQSFRAPTLYERFIRDAGIFTGTPNPDLDKETMTSYELGVFKKFGDRVSLDIAGFINDYDDLIESVITGSTFQYKNLNKARIYGVETNLNIRPIDEVNVNLAYTYMNAKNRSYDEDTAGALADNPDPEWLPYRPEHTASASVTWNTTKKLALNVSGRYVGKYKAITNFTNTEGTDYPGDFVVFNTGLKYKVNDNFSTTLLCNNLLNRKYEEVVWFRAPGRSFVLGVDFTY
ncbi:TonB-dependent receptor [Chlorobium phaeovibrioides]|uniref:TonB-dependent receptor n=1 Tax=Chlorobium phaeovibrioides TaxID=1094 RepID=UPI001230465B|nr:TonB-dependent receptor [Chlorobium phaeovibrioides]QEQ57485.1 TonB-dependent receptor [Chlorobium phaeovibrioides]